MKQVPADFVAYARTSLFTQETLPQSLREAHSTKPGVWAKIHLESGQVRFVDHSHQDELTLLSPELTGVVEPETLHHVEPIGNVQMYLEFYRRQ